jgi:hypothetical protein
LGAAENTKKMFALKFVVSRKDEERERFVNKLVSTKASSRYQLRVANVANTNVHFTLASRFWVFKICRVGNWLRVIT